MNSPNISIGIKGLIKSKRRAANPQHVNRISQIGDKCLRKLYYYRTAWDRAEPVTDELQGIFTTGTELEPKLRAIFDTEIGPNCEPPLRITATQVATTDKLLNEYKISGTIDGILEAKIDQRWRPVAVVDIKTASQHSFDGYSDLESLKMHTWSQRYIAQVMLYSFAHNLEHCALLFVNKNNIYSGWKLVWFPVDLEYVEFLLQKAKVINEAVDKMVPPLGVNRPDLCRGCQFLSHCTPDLTIGASTKNIVDTDIINMLDRWMTLKPVVKEYNQLDRMRKEAFIRGQAAVCGPYLITWKKIEKDETVIPARTEWRMKVESGR